MKENKEGEFVPKYYLDNVTTDSEGKKSSTKKSPVKGLAEKKKHLKRLKECRGRRKFLGWLLYETAVEKAY